MWAIYRNAEGKDQFFEKINKGSQARHKLVANLPQGVPGGRDCLNWVIENKIVLTYLIDACLKVFLISVIFQAAYVIFDIFHFPFDTTSVAGPSTKPVMESCVS